MFVYISLDRPRLRPILFGSHLNMIYELNYHSFISKVACGRWDITVYRTYLWVLTFIGYVIVVLLRKYSSIMGLFTNLNVGRKSSYCLSFLLFIDQERWWRMSTLYPVKLILLSINTLSHPSSCGIMMLSIVLLLITLIYFKICRTLVILNIQIFYANTLLCSLSWLCWFFIILQSTFLYYVLLFIMYPNPFLSSASCRSIWSHYVAILWLSYSFAWFSVSILT